MAGLLKSNGIKDNDINWISDSLIDMISELRLFEDIPNREKL